MEMIKPLQILHASLNKPVLVAVKGGREYRGVLDGYDQHMNVVLKNVEEIINKESRGVLNVAIVRGDNVIYISPP
jgi:small nuclear ribonucleoprotein